MDGSDLAHFLDARCGKLTASRMVDAIDFNQSGKPSAKRTQLLKDLLAERVTGNSVRHFVTAAMQHGLDWEDTAKMEYEMASGTVIHACETIDHPHIEMFAATPDGLLGREGVIECKCPTSSTYLEWIIEGVVPKSHKPQMTAQLACTGRKYAMFVAFDPNIKDKSKRLFVRKFEPSAEEIAKIEAQAKQFLDDLELMFQLFTATEPA